MSCYSPSPFEEPIAWCCICDKPVALEISKTNEDGEAVHEECYVDSLMVRSQSAYGASLRKPATEPYLEKWCSSALVSGMPTVLATPACRRVPSWAPDVAAVAILMLVAWFVYGDRGAATMVGLGLSNASTEPQAALLPAKPKAAEPGFKRVRVSPSETDYIAEDVTIRHFMRDPETRTINVGYKQVNLGDDVTVRYFASTFSQPGNGSVPARPIANGGVVPAQR